MRTLITPTDRRLLDAAMPGRELRLVELADIHVRVADDDDQPIGFKGHASVFNRRTLIGRSPWGWFEEIVPGAFKASIKADDIRMLKNHNTDLPLARNKAGSLRLAEDAVGLAVDADMDPVTYAFDLAVNLERGTVTQMSFGFEILTQQWITLGSEDPDAGKVMQPELRRVQKVKLWEVSTVTFPAYVDTDAGLRTFELELLAAGLGLDDEQLHELAAQLRGDTPNLEALRAVAMRLAPPATPATGSDAPATGLNSDQPAEPDTNTRQQTAGVLFPAHWDTKGHAA